MVLLLIMWITACFESVRCCAQDQKAAAPFYKRIAAHFEQAQSLTEAERFYIKAGLARQVSLLPTSPLAVVLALNVQKEAFTPSMQREAFTPNERRLTVYMPKFCRAEAILCMQSCIYTARYKSLAEFGQFAE